MEEAVDQLAKFFLKDGNSLESKPENNILCHAVIYEDIQNLVRMKMEYEAVKFIRQAQSFDQDYPQKVSLVWLGNYRGKYFPSS